MNNKIITLLSIFSINAAFAAGFNVPSGATQINPQTLVGYESGNVNIDAGVEVEFQV